jgi:hypothetical protein
MAQGKASPRAWDLLDELRGSIEAFDPTTDAQQALYEQELQRVHELSDARRERLLEAEAGLPAILWVVLLISGMKVVGFTYLFGMHTTVVHTLMVAALALRP